VFPGYWDARGNWLVFSNADWALDGGARAEQLSAQFPGGLGAFSRAEQPYLIWAPTCTRGRQAVVFTRQVNVPGVPSRAVFNLVTRSIFYPFSQNVLLSLQLVVNTHVVLSLSGKALNSGASIEYQLTAPQLKLFRLGENTLRVDVTKGELPVALDPKSASTCNKGSLGSSVGVAFGLEGDSSADLSVSSEHYARFQYSRGTAHAWTGNFIVHNAGPSAAQPGEFAFLAQTGFLEGTVGIGLRGPHATSPFGKCTSTTGVTTTGRLEVTCPFGLFPAGATAAVQLQIFARIPASESSGGVYDIPSSWSVNSFNHAVTYSGTPDPNPNNNGQSETLYLCGPQATDPKCPP